MRYTKAALALFGVGLAAGFVAVVVEGLPLLERAAAIAMALGIAALPLALFADGRGLALLAWLAARLRRRSKKRRAARGVCSKARAAKGPTAAATRKPAARRATKPARRKRS